MFDLYNLMQQAHTVDRPVRIKNFNEKIDEFNDKPVLTLGQQSRVQYSTRPIPFEHVKDCRKNESCNITA